MNDFNYENEIIEVNSDENLQESSTTLEDLIKKEAESNTSNSKNKKRKSINLTKKQKTILIIVGVILFILIIGLILYFSVLKKEDKKPEEPIEIVEKDNYRYENGKLIFLDKNEKAIGQYECVNKDSDKCYVAKINLENDNFDRVKSVNEAGTELEKNSKIYFDKYVFVYDDDKIFLYNMKDKEKQLNLQNIKSYNTTEELVIIENEDSKYGLIEIKEEGYEYLIRCSYDNLGIVNTDKKLLIAQDKDDYYIIDSTGKKLSDNINADIKSANENYIVAVKNNTYNLYSYDYEELLSDYDYISLHNGVISLVKNKRLFLVDENLSKLYEDGIRLENTDYIKKYVYNDKNKLVKTLKSYEVSLTGNEASITIGENTTNINILEGKYSSNLNYMSYFDGKLYFYSDEEKTDLLGTYTCKNKNNLTSNTDTLKNCNIYFNELGYSGIYNNEYVIISDNTNAENKEYYLYNLKEKKVKGTYNDIQVVLEKELNNQIKLIYTSSSFIIAKAANGSNKGNYGVLEVNSEKVQGKVGFNYENITKEKDYYKLLNIDKTYSIYNNNFVKISNEFSSIKLFDNYYVGINNNKLNIYSYTNTLGILENDISIKDNNYEIDFTNGFTITIDGIKHLYDINGKAIKNNQSSTEENNNSINGVENNGE